MRAWKFQDQIFLLGHPSKFHFVFNYPMEIPHAISLIPLGNPYPQPPPPPILIFSEIAQYQREGEDLEGPLIFHLFHSK